jgi:hypothetical protein
MPFQSLYWQPVYKDSNASISHMLCISNEPCIITNSRVLSAELTRSIPVALGLLDDSLSVCSFITQKTTGTTGGLPTCSSLNSNFTTWNSNIFTNDPPWLPMEESNCTKHTELSLVLLFATVNYTA